MIQPRDLLLATRIDPAELDALYRQYGFRLPQEADRNLREVVRSGADRQRLAPMLDTLLGAFGEAVDPDIALANFERYMTAVEDRSAFLDTLAAGPELIKALAVVLGGSNFLSGILLRHPEYLNMLPGEEARGPRPRKAFLDEARRSVAERSGDPHLAALHRFQHRELLRIGYRDLAGGVAVRDITNELSWLADATIQAVFEEAWREMEERMGPASFEFAVISVGKLGGEELNFSSDIDIFYIYSDDAHVEAATRLARRINEGLTERSAEGVFYRVDLRLRPEGSRGPLASSMRSLEIYYGYRGETFERLALAKSRPVAGHAALGAAFKRLVAPFVYRKYLDYEAIDEIREIKQRIDQQVDSSGELDRNIKLGRGGIREIEFFVQVLQVLYGGEAIDIRVRSTLDAIDRLEATLLIERAVARRLREAYIFLRNVEHKLQVVDQQQTHTLPVDPDELARTARRMKMSPSAFRRTLERHRSVVREIFEDLFSSRVKTEEGTPAAVHRFVNEAMPAEAAMRWLASVGFPDPRQAQEILASLRDAPAFGHSPTRMKNLLANVLAPLLEEAARLIRPAQVLVRFERLTTAMGAREAFFTSLLESPRSLPRLAQVFALSDPLSEILVRHPGTVEFLIDEGRLSRPLRPPFETRSREMLEFYIGVQYLFGVQTRKRASRLLTRFAEQEIRRAVSGDGPVALFALGKFGERELKYRSDLDVIAFYEGDYARAADFIEALVSGFRDGFRIDMRLRPEGRKGGLVWNLENTATYLRERALVWERLAWTKARFVAGDAQLAARFKPLIEEFVYGSEFGAAHVAEMAHIRRRMERELAREAEDAWDLKLGRGGLVDLEFLAEFIQIRDRIRIPNTALVLKCASAPVEWIEDYEFLREVESMLRLWSSLSTSRIEQADIAALETLLEVENFTERYREVTGRVREAFEGYVGKGQ